MTPCYAASRSLSALVSSFDAVRYSYIIPVATGGVATDDSLPLAHQAEAGADPANPSSPSSYHRCISRCRARTSIVFFPLSTLRV
jgi:hypothetical protein